MNVTSYLPDALVQSLDKLAREQRSSRSAIVREALEHYLRRFQASAWPDEIMAWQGDVEFPAFESLRGPEQRRDRDPFAGEAGT